MKVQISGICRERKVASGWAEERTESDCQWMWVLFWGNENVPELDGGHGCTLGE
jgi:hypothetical protein